ncbi:MAG: ATP-binding protein [Fimbriimonas sp.]
MIRRFISERLGESLADTPVTMVVGPRQSGKSTVVQEFRERRYVSLDDPMVLAHALSDPGGFLDAYGDPLTIDEIQRAPSLLLPMKLRVDRDRRPGRFLLTGSANVLALPKVSESLAGRMEVLDLPPMTQSEIDGTQANFVDALVCSDPLPREANPISKDDIIQRILRGGFPEPVTRVNQRRRSAWFTAYIRTMLERDVRDIANIAGLSQLPRVLNLLAIRNGETLNLAALGRDTGIPHTTLTRYLDLLKAIYVIQLVPAWSVDDSTRYQKTSRCYIVDTGLASALASVEEGSLQDRDLLDRMLRAFVSNELGRQISGGAMTPTLLHLRTVRQKQVEFVLEGRDGRISGLDVTSSTDITESDLEGLRFLAEVSGDRFHRGAILTMGPEVRPIGVNLWAVPISMLWSA